MGVTCCVTLCGGPKPRPGTWGEWDRALALGEFTIWWEQMSVSGKLWPSLGHALLRLLDHVCRAEPCDLGCQLLFPAWVSSWDCVSVKCLSNALAV